MCQVQKYKYYIKYNSGGVEELSVQQDLESIKPYLHDIISSFKKSAERKIPMTMKPKFIRSTDSNEKRIIHTTDLEKSMKGSNSVIDYADGLHYKCHKIVLKVVDHIHIFS